MRRKIFVAIIISFLMIFENINVVYCSGLEVLYGLNAVYTGLHNAVTTQEKANAISDWIHKNSEAAGFLFDFTATQQPLTFLIDICPQSWIDNLSSDPTEEEIYDAVIEGITSGQSVSNNSIVYNDNTKTFINNFINYLKDEDGYNIGYSLDLQYYSNFNGQNEQSTIVQNIKSWQGDNYVYMAYKDGYPYPSYYFVTPKEDYKAYMVDDSGTDIYRMNFQNSITFQEDSVSNSRLYYLDVQNQNGSFRDDISFTYDYFFRFRAMKRNYSYRINEYNPQWNNSGVLIPQEYQLVTWGKVDQIVIYDDIATLQNTARGMLPYYYNNQVWNNFSNSTGDYTVTSSNVNTVTYGDVISYVNDYHDTNNNYPDNSTVNNWIETTNNNNNPGGGSGDDSGGGSGGSGDDSGGSGIVSILTALGKAIADLVTGIAAFLAEVVGGLVEAITGLLDTLTDLITNFTDSIPNIFSPLLGWLFDGLPEEFTAIILLGLTACVIASIIKILRG